MNHNLVAGLLALQMAATGARAADAPAPPAAQQPSAAARADVKPSAAGGLDLLRDDPIHQAVRAARSAGQPDEARDRATDALRGTFEADHPQAIMTRAFEQAKIPGCLRPNALKLAPPHIGPVQVNGELALPWLAYAILKGKCKAY